MKKTKKICFKEILKKKASSTKKAITEGNTEGQKKEQQKL